MAVLRTFVVHASGARGRTALEKWEGGRSRGSLGSRGNRLVPAGKDYRLIRKNRGPEDHKTEIGFGGRFCRIVRVYHRYGHAQKNLWTSAEGGLNSACR